MKHLLILLTILFTFISCGNEEYPPLETVATLEVDKYLGTWYEIARLPNRFEEGLECVSATYTLKDNGKIDVLNKGMKTGDKKGEDVANGVAWVPDPAKPSQLKVRFFWPFAGDYYVLALGDDYEYSLVGDPSRKFMWVLSRNKTMEEAQYNSLLDIAKERGFDINALEKVNQACM